MINLEKVKKILIINICGIGDVLFTTPLISNLKEKLPEAAIGFIGNRRTESILKNNPKVDKVYIYERDEFHEIYKQSKMKYYKAARAFFKEIRADNYDLVFDISLNRSVSFLTFLMGIKHRIGYNYKNRSKFLTVKRPLDKGGYKDRHIVEYYLALLRDINVAVSSRNLEIYFSDEDKKWADEFLAEREIGPGTKIIGIIPGGGSSWGADAKFKQWPPEKFSGLINEILSAMKAEIILFGDKNDIRLCEALKEKLRYPVYSACGETTIEQFAALVQRCHCVVANDGGPLHIAVAAGVPTVSIFGPVDERVYGPFPRDNHRVISGNNGSLAYHGFRLEKERALESLHKVSVSQVFDQVMTLV